MLAGALTLALVGLRGGDRLDDARLVSVIPEPGLPAIHVSVTNPGDAPVLVGLSLRRPGLRLRLEGGHYVKVRSGRATPGGLATSQTTLGVLEPRATGSFLVPGPTLAGARAELVAFLGQPGRLREIHRGVRLRQPEGQLTGGLPTVRTYPPTPAYPESRRDPYFP
jgi:hypothetical protein